MSKCFKQITVFSIVLYISFAPVMSADGSVRQVQGLLKICDIRDRCSGAFETWWFIGFSNKHFETACKQQQVDRRLHSPCPLTSLLPVREAHVRFARVK